MISQILGNVPRDSTVKENADALSHPAKPVPPPSPGQQSATLGIRRDGEISPCIVLAAELIIWMVPDFTFAGYLYRLYVVSVFFFIVIIVLFFSLFLIHPLPLLPNWLRGELCSPRDPKTPQRGNQTRADLASVS